MSKIFPGQFVKYRYGFKDVYSIGIIIEVGGPPEKNNMDKYFPERQNLRNCIILICGKVDSNYVSESDIWNGSVMEGQILEIT